MVGHFGIRMPEWFGNLTRSLLTLEGTLRSIDSGFSLVEAAQRRFPATRWHATQRHFGPRGRDRGGYRPATEASTPSPTVSMISWDKV